MWESFKFFQCKIQISFHHWKRCSRDRCHVSFDYQSLIDDGIGEKAWRESKSVDGSVGGEVFHHRMDVLWWYISDIVEPGSPKKRFLAYQKLVSLFSYCSTRYCKGSENILHCGRKHKWQ